MSSLVEPAVPAGAFAARVQPVLTAGALTLRPFRAEDARALVAAYDDPAIRHWHGRSMTQDEAADWIESRDGRWSGEQGADWAVVGTDGLIGRVGLRTLELFHGQGEAAYWVIPAARGRGIAFAALSAMTQWLFDEVGLHRIALVHSTRNEPSCRVATKAGFALEGTLRGDLLHADGWHDVHLHARLQHD